MFDNIKFEWQGKTKTVFPSRLMGLIYEIERHAGIQELADIQNLKASQISMAYGAALRYAGFDVEDLEAHKHIVESSGENFIPVAAHLLGVVALTQPPEDMDEDDDKKKDE